MLEGGALTESVRPSVGFFILAMLEYDFHNR